MAVTAATLTGDFAGFLTPDRAQGIFDRAEKASVVQGLVQKVPLGANGVEIPVITGRPTVGWVAEAGQKPASKGSMALKTISPKKAAAIVVTSAEVVRANPGGYIDKIRPQLGEAFAMAFDRAALYDKGPDGTAGAGPFASWINQTTKAVEIGTTAAAGGGIHGDLTAALSLLVAAGKKLTGWAVDDQFEPLLEGAADTTGRPLYVDLPSETDNSGLTARGRLLRRPSLMTEGVASADAAKVLGFGGDWREAAWGVVGGISYDVSTQATVTINGALVSLWENNLVAIRAEAEYGFLVNDPEAFVRLTNAV